MFNPQSRFSVKKKIKWSNFVSSKEHGYGNPISLNKSNKSLVTMNFTAMFLCTFAHKF